MPPARHPADAGAREALAAGFTHGDPMPGARGFAAGGPLDVMEPGPVLAGFAADADAGGLGRLSDDELVGVVRGWRRLGSWVVAGELAAVAELADRRYGQAAALGESPDRAAASLEAELACALTLTARGAQALVERAGELARLPGTAAALRAGVIDEFRARVIADQLSVLDVADARRAEDRLLATASGQTSGQLRAAAARAVLAADPEAAVRRREQAQRDARVEVWGEPAGTAAIAGRDLPPAEVLAADKRISALARRLKHDGAHGSMDHLRAKVYLALLAGIPVQELAPNAVRPDRPSAQDGASAPASADPPDGADPSEGDGAPQRDGAPQGDGAGAAYGDMGSHEAAAEDAEDAEDAGDADTEDRKSVV